jgi:GH24 family phage-related lysozyme (muramidase)
MLPDGIASTTVLSALEQYNRTRKHGSHVNYDAGKYPFVLQILWGMPGLIDSSALVSYPTASLSTSDDGGALMLYDETHDNYSVTSFLHFPDPEHCATDASGVTLGPGYDMGSRTEQKIVADLTAKGVDVDLVSAIQASKAAKLKSCDANDFVKKNVGIIKINLKEKQQIALMKRYLPPYEKWVRDIIRVDLLQREFDALTSLSANSAGVLGHVCHLINSGNVAEALGTIMEATGNNPGTKAGLKKRRSREVEFYLTGKFTREEKNVSSRMPHHAHQAK